MSHFARVENGIVKQVIRADQTFIDNLVSDQPGEWIQTSFNTHANQHKLGGTPLRGNFAGVGYIYDREHDVFYPPKPTSEGTWILDTGIFLWKRPLDYPTDGQKYYWDENLYQSDNTTGWVLKTNQEGDSE